MKLWKIAALRIEFLSLKKLKKAKIHLILNILSLLYVKTLMVFYETAQIFCIETFLSVHFVEKPHWI